MGIEELERSKAHTLPRITDPCTETWSKEGDGGKCPPVHSSCVFKHKKSPMMCSACACKDIVPPSFPQPCQLPPEVQAARQSSVSLFQHLLLGLSKHPVNLEPTELFAKRDCQAFHQETGPSCPLCQHCRDPHCAEALLSSPSLVLMSSFSPARFKAAHWTSLL